MLSDCKANVINWFGKYIAPNVTPSAKGGGSRAIFNSSEMNLSFEKQYYPFLAVWEIIKGLGHGGDDFPNNDDDSEDSDEGPGAAGAD